MSRLLPPATPTSLGVREDALARLEAETFDVLVVGGGITGAGVALDAASRGLRTALVEKADFASGTSSRSSKLVHGGLRYLAQRQVGVTRASIVERGLLRGLAPHLVQPLPFVTPIYGRRASALAISGALWLYDLLALRAPLGRHRWLSPASLRRWTSGVEPRGLAGGFLYYDCLTDDARLTLAVLKTAAAHGAALANYLAVRGFAKTQGRTRGAWVRDRHSGRELLVRARRVILATGVWLDGLLALDGATERCIRPAKGVHVVVAGTAFSGAATITPRAQDGRFLLLIPWRGHTVIGTTDTEYEGDLDAPRVTEQDVEYLLSTVRRVYPGVRLGEGDIISAQAGLRPLVGGAAASTVALSREERVFETPSGLIAIAGGKLTTYRHMAERVVDLVVRRLREDGAIGDLRACVTDRLPLAGAPADGDRDRLALAALADCEQLGLGAEVAAHLLFSYGSEYKGVLALAAASPDLGQPMVPGLPMLRAEVIWAARREQAQTVGDVLVRRTRAVLLAPDQAVGQAGEVAALLREALGWQDEMIDGQIAAYRQEAEQYSPQAII